jgi:hypothetical protein
MFGRLQKHSQFQKHLRYLNKEDCFAESRKKVGWKKKKIPSSNTIKVGQFQADY